MDHAKIKALLDEDAHFLKVANELIRDPSFEELDESDIEDIFRFFNYVSRLSGMFHCRGDVRKSQGTPLN